MITERDVEAKFLPNLFCDRLGYKKEDLRYAVPVSFFQGREKLTKQADLVIDFNGKPIIVVEAKKPTESLKSWINQVDSYAFALKTKYGIVTNGKDIIIRGYYDGNSRINLIESSVEDLEKQHWQTVQQIISVNNITNSINLKTNAIPKISSNEITNYRSFFKSLHDMIRDREKLDPAKSFDELSKLLFIKIAESEENKELLTIHQIESFENIDITQADTYIQSVFQNAVKKIFPDVFDHTEKIELTPSTVKAILYELQNFTLKDGKQDIKGRAFEEFLPSQLRGKGLGQFFTPRPIVDFMVKMANVSIHDVVIDFSCGSGGFLIKSFESILNDITKLPSDIWGRIGKTKDDFLEEVKSYHLHGIDAEPRATRIAKMNMMLWGDGKRVVRGNGLDIKDKSGNPYKPLEYNKEYDNNPENKIKSGCTLILANPPFGSVEGIEKAKKGETSEEKVKREKRNQLSNNILSRYELAKGKESQKTEILFLEKGIKLLRPQGRMFIVIPNGIISNPTYDYVRDYIMKNADIKAVISLPTHTFVQSGVDTIETVVLYVEKFTEDKKRQIDELLLRNEYKNMIDLFKDNKDLSYKIFMSVAEYVGFEPSGKIIKNDIKTDLELILQDFIEQKEILNEIDILDFANEKYLNKNYAKGSKGNKITRGVKNKNEHISYYIDVIDLEGRIDPAYYFFKNNTSHLMKSFIALKQGLIKPSENKTVNKKNIQEGEEYRYLSCTANGLIELEEKITLDTISNQKYKIVEEGDIVYNPYRINIGSIGIVTKEMSGAIVSGAYVVFKCTEKLNPLFLINILKTPFYKLYISLIKTGSIRDNLGYDLLETIKIPNTEAYEQLEIVKTTGKFQDEIFKMQSLIKDNEIKISAIFQDFFKNHK